MVCVPLRRNCMPPLPWSAITSSCMHSPVVLPTSGRQLCLKHTASSLQVGAIDPTYDEQVELWPRVPSWAFPGGGQLHYQTLDSRLLLQMYDSTP